MESHTPTGYAYHELHKAARHSWWRALLGALAAGVLMVVVAPLALSLLFSGWKISTDPLNPAGLAYTSLGLACAIPIVVVVSRVVHGLSAGWVASVAGRLRWRWLAACLVLSVIALVVTLVVSSLLPGSADQATGVGGSPNDFTATTRDFLLIILVLTPLQAAGEEYLFRGYLTQAVGGVFGRTGRVLAVVVPAVLFALAHGTQSGPVFIDRLAFGLLAGVLVILTGGLEAGIAMHILNNFLAFGLALAFSDMTTVLQPTESSWWNVVVTVTRSVVYLALVVLAGRRAGLATRTTGADFAPRTSAL